MPLTNTFVKQVKHSGKTTGDKHWDGSGMYLLVKASGKYWRMDYTYLTRRKTLALGVYPQVSLLQARDLRAAARAGLAAGVDPSQTKQRAKMEAIEAVNHTFEIVAREWLQKTSVERMPSTHKKVTNWLEKDVIPFIGALPISQIGPRDVLSALRKMEQRGALDSLQRVKQVCGQVFRFAVSSGYAERDVTYDLKGALTKHIAKHRPAITDPAQLGMLLRCINNYDGYLLTRAALKLAPHVFLRPAELRKAEWAEIDLEDSVWKIPASRMKLRIEHHVPLSSQVVQILKGLQRISGHGRYVFPGLRTGERPLSENTLNAALRVMGYSKETHCTQGFRATARTIMDEVLNERVDLIEHQLAHAVKDANGRVYNRTSHMPARREMMQRWSDSLDKLGFGAEIVSFDSAKAA